MAVVPEHIKWGWWIIAMTLGFSLFTFIVFLILNPERGNTFKFKGISILILVLLILTHHLSSLITLVALLTSYLGYVIYTAGYKSKERLAGISSTIVILFGVALLSYWLYVSHFFTDAVEIGLGSAVERMGIMLTIPAIQPNAIWLEINKSGLLLFYGLSIIGILSMLNRKYINGPRFTLLFCGVCLTIITFAGVALGIRNLFASR